MSVIGRIRRALRGEISVGAVLREAGWRGRAAFGRGRERAMLDRLARQNGAGKDLVPRLSAEYARMSGPELLEHFRSRARPKFFAFEDASAARRERDAAETMRLLEGAEAILNAHRWPLLGYGELDFGAEIDWLRDPVSGAVWSPDYHAKVVLVRGDGSDVRVLWELNRLSHLSTLARAYAVTRDGRFAEECFAQIESWRTRNPVGRGPNWSCAMEVALRALNLLAAFQLVRRAPELNEARLRQLLSMFDEHGAHVRRNLEFSHIATSNHYLSDVVGLFWLGLCLPELRAAREWREFGLREMLREMDKQVLADGAHCEASTGYHRFVTELFLYSFILARDNHVEIDVRYLRKLRAMLDYVRAYLRPDGRAPLIGDADGGRVMPLVVSHEADDHAYVLAVGAAFFNDPRYKVADAVPEELTWLLGGPAVESYEKLRRGDAATSASFAHAGACVMREGDLYLLFNVSGAGLNGRGSHGHNDALSIEVSACGHSFIADAGTHLYTADLRARQLFRSTAYHSTVEVDGEEQNTTDKRTPFVIGDEARPRLLRWSAGPERDVAVAEHVGYERLRQPVTHRRAVVFDKRERYWLIEDELRGAAAEHVFRFRFHAAPEVEARVRDDSIVELHRKATEARLLIVALDVRERAVLEPAWSSRDYGDKRASQVACWTLRARPPLAVAWALVPVRADEDEARSLELIARLPKRREQN